MIRRTRGGSMQHATIRSSLALGLALGVAIALTGLSARLAGQSNGSARPSAPLSSFRTPDGVPDLQGTYNIATLTPIERPANMPLVITPQQARQLERTEAARVQRAAEPSPVDRPAPQVGAVGGYNNFWIDRGDRVIVVNGEPRSSLIVDPTNGLIPPQTEEGRRRNTARAGEAVRPTADAPESAVPQGLGAY